jgi:hypothetical protein
VVTGAFQMLCPGCVEHCIPQLRNVAATFGGRDVVVLGLHTVFEHHEAMTPVALKAFLHEYRVTFPVAIDEPDPGGLPVPVTMGRHRLRGTPTLLLHDRSGQLRSQRFGHVPDLQLGADITRLLLEGPPRRRPLAPTPAARSTERTGCGYDVSMTQSPEDRRVAERSELLPEEAATGSADPEAQAEAILADSDERVEDPEGTREDSSQTPDRFDD